VCGQFVFDGGILAPGQIASIKLTEQELASFAFLEPAEAVDRLIPRLARRISAACQARAASVTTYLEHGAPVSQQSREWR